jgi:hypothetical protein
MKRPRNLETEETPVLPRGFRSARREPVQGGKAADQPTLFPLIDDSRPATARRADDRYREPGLFDDRNP